MKNRLKALTEKWYTESSQPTRNIVKKGMLSQKAQCAIELDDILTREEVVFDFPVVFEIKEMARMAANSFSGETGNDWMVVCRHNQFGSEYKPHLSANYTNDMKREGWFIIE